MPLRDHFHPPLDDRASWEGLHGAWPTVIVMTLNPSLPTRYVAEPLVHLVITDLPDQDEYEVRVFDTKRHRRLVAAVELVSPANKDRPENRRAFVAKCATLLQQQVSITIVDLVTTRQFNLYADLLDLIGQSDPSLAPAPPGQYAAACRWKPADNARQLETWAHALFLGQPLPTLPLWLADNFAVPLELDASYEEACRILRIA
jgi:hypothetical protein